MISLGNYTLFEVPTTSCLHALYYELTISLSMILPHGTKVNTRLDQDGLTRALDVETMGVLGRKQSRLPQLIS